MLEPKQSHSDKFVKNLQQKLQIAFNATFDLLRFLDLDSKENVTVEEFMFGVNFFV